MSALKIERSALLYEIATLAYVVADVGEGTASPHALHQTFDICSRGNIDRVDSLLTLAAADVGMALGAFGSMTEEGGDFIFRLGGISEARTAAIVSHAREYMVAGVLYGWLSVTLPAEAAVWKTRRDEALTSLQTSLPLPTGGFRRRLPPI